MFRFFSANHPCVRLVPLLLGVFLISLVIPVLTPTTHAATLAHHDIGCIHDWTYGTSYDGDTLTLSQEGYGPTYSFSQQWAPALAVSTCGSNGYGTFDMESNIVGASYYNLAYTTAANQTYVVTLNNSKITTYGSEMAFQATGFPLHQVYTFQLQACYSGYGCTSWSPHVTSNTYTDIRCQSGYEFRGAYPYDQVCVTPTQYNQVQLDNDVADTRVNPNGANGPRSCINGYVWRDAIGADYVCVTPGERAQAWSDNSQSSARILQV